MEEIEVKFLNVDQEKLQEQLVALGATKEFDRVYRRKVYDYPDLRLNAESAWIRVRDEGDKVTMGFKKRIEPGIGENDAGMHEIEMSVSSFDTGWQFLEAIGLQQKFYEENRRIRYVLDDLEFDIDFWPLLPPYLEIEAPSWQRIDDAIAILGLNANEKKICSTFQIYEMNGIDELSYDILTLERQIKK